VGTVEEQQSTSVVPKEAEIGLVLDAVDNMFVLRSVFITLCSKHLGYILPANLLLTLEPKET
jgi:hypothetical protein